MVFWMSGFPYCLLLPKEHLAVQHDVVSILQLHPGGVFPLIVRSEDPLFGLAQSRVQPGGGPGGGGEQAVCNTQILVIWFGVCSTVKH